MNARTKGPMIVLVIAAFFIRVLAVPSSYKGDPGDTLRTAQKTAAPAISSLARPNPGPQITPEVSPQGHITLWRSRLADRPALKRSFIVVRLSPPAFLPQPFISSVSLLHPPT